MLPHSESLPLSWSMIEGLLMCFIVLCLYPILISSAVHWAYGLVWSEGFSRAVTPLPQCLLGTVTPLPQCLLGTVTTLLPSVSWKWWPIYPSDCWGQSSFYPVASWEQSALYTSFPSAISTKKGLISLMNKNLHFNVIFENFKEFPFYPPNNPLR